MSSPTEARLHPALTRKALRKYPWLRYLARAFLLADKLSDRRIAEERRLGRAVACHPGCCHCCRELQVPVNRLELQGISWYVCEVLHGKKRAMVRQQLESFPGLGYCPFLVDGLCAVRPVRPLSCRQFFVFTTACREDEDVRETRPDDTLRMGRVENTRELKEIATLMLQGLGLGSQSECVVLARSGELLRQATDMLTLALNEFVGAMDRFSGHD